MLIWWKPVLEDNTKYVSERKSLLRALVKRKSGEMCGKKDMKEEVPVEKVLVGSTDKKQKWR